MEDERLVSDIPYQDTLDTFDYVQLKLKKGRSRHTFLVVDPRFLPEQLDALKTEYERKNQNKVPMDGDFLEYTIELNRVPVDVIDLRISYQSKRYDVLECVYSDDGQGSFILGAKVKKRKRNFTFQINHLESVMLSETKLCTNFDYPDKSCIRKKITKKWKG